MSALAENIDPIVIMVCTDCLMGIANDDYSGLDYHLSPEESEQRETEIREAIANLDGFVCVGDSTEDESFSVSTCECCRTFEAGSRHQCVLL